MPTITTTIGYRNPLVSRPALCLAENCQVTASYNIRELGLEVCHNGERHVFDDVCLADGWEPWPAISAWLLSCHDPLVSDQHEKRASEPAQRRKFALGKA